MRNYLIVFLILISLLLVSACSYAEGQEGKYVNVPDIEDYPILKIQVVDANGAVTDTARLNVADDSRIKDFIHSLGQIEVTAPSKKELLNQMKQMQSEEYYMFIMANEKIEDFYLIDFARDGNILFQSESTNEIIYSSIDNHQLLLEEFLAEMGL